MQRQIILGMAVLFLLTFAACNSDDNWNKEPETGSSKIELAVTGRVGTLVGENLAGYVKSLDLFLFRQNTGGVYQLFKNVSYNESEIEALTAGTTEAASGFTEPRTIDFGGLPVGIYVIVGVGNMRDSTGTDLPNATLSGITTGNTMEEVIAAVTAGNTSPRIFFGQTEAIQLGAQQPATPQLSLFRKVAMFDLTLENVPSVVKRIDVQVGETYGAFNMTGNFLNDRVISVTQQNNYNFSANQPSLPISLITMPTVTGEQSDITLIFYLDNGQTITIPLPSPYALKANTITKLTATINADQEGGQWNVDLTISISADVEWNVDQEPGIII